MHLFDLPNEVLLRIFDYIDKGCFKDVVLTCKKFNELACTSKLIENYRLVFDFPDFLLHYDDDYNERDIERQLLDADVCINSIRSYDTLIIKNFRQDHLRDQKLRENFWRILEARGHEFKTLKIYYCISPFHEMQMIFQSFQNLKTLAIFGSYINAPHGFDNVRPLFQGKLERLDIYNTDDVYLQLIGETVSLKSITIRLIGTFNPSSILDQFISKQTNLKILELGNISNCEIFTGRSFKDSKISLEKLELDQVDVADKESLRRFLESQMELEEINFAFANIFGNRHPGGCYDTIMSTVIKLPKLRNVTFSLLYYCFIDPRVFHSIRNHSVKNLNLLYNEEDTEPETVLALLNGLPELEDLEVTFRKEGGMPEATKIVIAEIGKLKNLKKLKFNDMDLKFLEYLKIESPKFEAIHLSICRGDLNAEKFEKFFTMNGEKIKKLSIGEINSRFSIDDSFCTSIKKLNSVQTIRLMTHNFSITQERFVLILENCNGLKELEMGFSLEPLSVIKSIIFKKPKPLRSKYRYVEPFGMKILG